MAVHVNPAFRRLFTLATLLKLCAVSFYFGYRRAAREGGGGLDPADGDGDGGPAAAARCAPPTEPSAAVQRRINARLREELSRADGEDYAGTIFPRGSREFLAGALRVPRDELLHKYDFGVPFKRLRPGEDAESLIVYNTPKSLPSDEGLRTAAVNGRDDGEIGKASVDDATEGCDALNVVFTSLAGGRNPEQPHCHALIGNFESYHINRLQRMPDFDVTNRKKRQLNHTLPLRHMGRLVLPKGTDEFDLPVLWDDFSKRRKGFLLQHFDALRTWLENVDSVLKELAELLKRRNVVRDNAVVVMTVNAGQSELLSNFVCAARSRGLDTGNVLVFPTDEESYRRAKGLGVATYFDEKNLGRLPSGEAQFYGDPTFASMMYAKVLCVLYVSLLGHDVLFQDVDVVWFKDPLSYFRDESNSAIRDFDILFQHDGSAQPRYNPLSANSGFYYVRAHKKTQYLFMSLLYHGAVVRKSKSHQQVLVQLLSEHSSMFGLRVKVFDKVETDMFPGGFHFHQDWDTMRKIVEGESNAYVLHMSWTENKVNKLLFFRQMGEWYLEDRCIGGDPSDGGGGAVSDGGLVEKCCSREPIFSCHFRDKPSKRPCPDSPRIDPNRGRSFWK